MRRGIDPQAAALIEPYAISAHAVRRAAVAPGEQVLVVGAGPIGLGAAAIAKADGAQVVVADTSPARREHVVSRLGLPVIDPSAEDFDAQLRDQFGGSLAQKVIDATGNQHAMNNTVNLIRHGGSIVFVGLFKGDLQFSDPEFHKRDHHDGQSQRHTGRFRQGGPPDVGRQTDRRHDAHAPLRVCHTGRNLRTGCD